MPLQSGQFDGGVEQPPRGHAARDHSWIQLREHLDLGVHGELSAVRRLLRPRVHPGLVAQLARVQQVSGQRRQPGRAVDPGPAVERLLRALGSQREQPPVAGGFRRRTRGHLAQRETGRRTYPGPGRDRWLELGGGARRRAQVASQLQQGVRQRGVRQWRRGMQQAVHPYGAQQARRGGGSGQCGHGVVPQAFQFGP